MIIFVFFMRKNHRIQAYVLLVFSMFNSQRLAEAHEVFGTCMIYMADFSDYSAVISAMQSSLFQVCHNKYKYGWFLKKSLSPIVILSMEKTMIAMVISELKSISGLQFLAQLP